MGRECLEMDLSSRQRSFSPVAGTDRHGQGINSRTPPNCARCRNHDIIVPLKGHKRYCKFNECTCEKCQLTADRQKVMARQTAIRRAEEQDRQRVKNGLPVPGRSSPRGGGGSPPPNSGSMSIPIECSEPDNSCSSKPDTPSTSKAKLAAISRRNSTSASVDHGKDMWDNILLLLNWCGLPVNTTPLLHVILSKITSDANEVYRFIREASEELKQTCPIKDDVRRQPTPLDHLSPWAPLYYPPTVPHAIPQPPSLYKQSTHHYHPGLALPSLRYHPYQVLPPTYKTSLLRTFDPLGYSLHEATRPSVVVPTDYYYRTDDRLDGKPTSPSSVHSDKSSYSGSVEI